MGPLSAPTMEELACCAIIAGVFLGIKNIFSAIGSVLKKDNETDNEIRKDDSEARLYRSKAETDVWKAEQEMKLKKKYKETSTIAPSEVPDGSNVDLQEYQNWYEEFHRKFTMPELPDFLKPIMSGVPEGYHDAMLAHLLSMFGAICFSNVRSEYLDDQEHAPNIQVIIEAPWGSGKAKFEVVYKTLFQRIIEETAWKRKNNYYIDYVNGKAKRVKIKRIFQIAGFNTSQSRIFEILADNDSVHFYMFESEARAARTAIKKGNGPKFEHLRKAFEGGMVDQDNKSHNTPQGTYPAYINYTITGTPEDVRRFMEGELEGGTASRIIFSTFPEEGRVPDELKLPKGDHLKNIQDQVDHWRLKYCCRKGEEMVGDDNVPRTTIELDYVNDALKKWIDDQFSDNPARKSARKRMACIAFHCAIVLAMIEGIPDATMIEKRKRIVDLTLYIANMCMERFLFKFGDQQNKLYYEEKSKEHSQILSNAGKTNGPSEPVAPKVFDPDVICGGRAIPYSIVKAAYERNQSDTDKLGLKQIPKYYREFEGLDSTQVKRFFQKARLKRN